MPRRQYRQKSTGQAVKGITTILSILSKPALVPWGYSQGMNNFNRLMAWIAQNHSELMEQLKSFIENPLYEKRDKAADAGILAHSFFENHIKGLPDPFREGIPQDVLSKAEGCYITFLDWEKSNSIKYIDSEVELTSEELPMGGTIDAIIQGTLTPVGMVDILDYKTGKDIYLEAKIQVKSYGKLWTEHHPELPVAGFHILRLGENGEFTHKYFPNLDEKYFNIFLDCLDISVKLNDLGEKL